MEGLDGLDYWAMIAKAKERADIASNCLGLIIEEPDATGLLKAVRHHGERLAALADELIGMADSRRPGAGADEPPHAHERCAALDEVLAQARNGCDGPGSVPAVAQGSGAGVTKPPGIEG